MNVPVMMVLLNRSLANQSKKLLINRVSTESPSDLHTTNHYLALITNLLFSNTNGYSTLCFLNLQLLVS